MNPQLDCNERLEKLEKTVEQQSLIINEHQLLLEETQKTLKKLIDDLTDKYGQYYHKDLQYDLDKLQKQIGYMSDD